MNPHTIIMHLRNLATTLQGQAEPTPVQRRALANAITYIMAAECDKARGE